MQIGVKWNCLFQESIKKWKKTWGIDDGRGRFYWTRRFCEEIAKGTEFFFSHSPPIDRAKTSKETPKTEALPNRILHLLPSSSFFSFSLPTPSMCIYKEMKNKRQWKYKVRSRSSQRHILSPSPLLLLFLRMAPTPRSALRLNLWRHIIRAISKLKPIECMPSTWHYSLHRTSA